MNTGYQTGNVCLFPLRPSESCSPIVTWNRSRAVARSAASGSCPGLWWHVPSRWHPPLARSPVGGLCWGGVNTVLAPLLLGGSARGGNGRRTWFETKPSHGLRVRIPPGTPLREGLVPRWYRLFHTLCSSSNLKRSKNRKFSPRILSYPFLGWVC